MKDLMKDLMKKPTSKLNLLHCCISPKDVRNVLRTLRKLGIKGKVIGTLEKEHNTYVELLKFKLNNVPHFVEKRVQDMPFLLGVRTLRQECGLGTREALWIHKYLTKGIFPWFMTDSTD